MSDAASITTARVAAARAIATHAAWMCVAWMIASWALGRLLPRCIGVMVRAMATSARASARSSMCARGAGVAGAGARER